MKKFWKPALLLCLCILVISSGTVNARYKTTLNTGSFALTITKQLTGKVTIENDNGDALPPTVGHLLIAKVTELPKGAEPAYQWYRDNEPIKDATEDSYRLTVADIGKTLKCVVTDAKGSYTGSIESDPTKAVEKAELKGTVTLSAVSIAVGESVTAQVSGTPDDAVLAYQWYRDGVAISGATDSDYTAESSDKGTTLTCAVTDTSGKYSGQLSSGEADVETAFAVYSETDNSLRFYNRVVPDVGTDLDDRIVTAVYTGFDSTTYTESSAPPWIEHNQEITTVEVIDTEIAPTSIAYWFNGGTLTFGVYNYPNLTSVDLTKLDTSKLTSMTYTFSSCKALTTIRLGSNFDTSKVEAMNYTFAFCDELSTLEVGDKFVTPSVTTMSNMFNGCSALTSLKFVENFDTSNVTSMRQMFQQCTISELNLSNFNTQKVTDMYYMFYSCTGLSSLDLSSFNTENVTDMRQMFMRCSSLTTLNLSSFDTAKVTNMENIFRDCSKLQTIYVGGSFNTDRVGSSSVMFHANNALKGGSGTSFSTNSNRTKTWAVIDGEKGQPGYFTGIVHINVDNNFTANTGMDAGNNTGSLYGITWDFNGTGNFNVGQDSTIRLYVADGYTATLPSQVILTAGDGTTKTADVDPDTGIVSIPGEMMKEYHTITISRDIFRAYVKSPAKNRVTFYADEACTQVLSLDGYTGSFENVNTSSLTDAVNSIDQYIAPTYKRIYLYAVNTIKTGDNADVDLALEYTGSRNITLYRPADGSYLIQINQDVGEHINVSGITLSDGGVASAYPLIYQNRNDQGSVSNFSNLTLELSSSTLATGRFFNCPVRGTLPTMTNVTLSDGTAISVDDTKYVLINSAAAYAEEDTTIPTIGLVANIGEKLDFWMADVEMQYPEPGKDYGLIFAPCEGYALAETITVDIGGTLYTVNTDGSSNAEGLPAFDPAAHVLTIPAALLTEDTSLVVITAEAIPLAGETGEDVLKDGLGDPMGFLQALSAFQQETTNP